MYTRPDFNWNTLYGLTSNTPTPQDYPMEVDLQQYEKLTSRTGITVQVPCKEADDALRTHIDSPLVTCFLPSS